MEDLGDASIRRRFNVDKLKRLFKAALDKVNNSDERKYPIFFLSDNFDGLN